MLHIYSNNIDIFGSQKQLNCGSAVYDVAIIDPSLPCPRMHAKHLLIIQSLFDGNKAGTDIKGISFDKRTTLLTGACTSILRSLKSQTVEDLDNNADVTFSEPLFFTDKNDLRSFTWSLQRSSTRERLFNNDAVLIGRFEYFEELFFSASYQALTNFKYHTYSSLLRHPSSSACKFIKALSTHYSYGGNAISPICLSSLKNKHLAPVNCHTSPNKDGFHYALT